MDAKRIISFLTRVAQNNNRPWFQEHKAEFEACKTDFEAGITQLIATLATMDPEVAHLTVRDCCYRFYRDTRFSADKCLTSATSVLTFAPTAVRPCAGATMYTCSPATPL